MRMPILPLKFLLLVLYSDKNSSLASNICSQLQLSLHSIGKNKRDLPQKYEANNKNKYCV